MTITITITNVTVAQWWDHTTGVGRARQPWFDSSEGEDLAPGQLAVTQIASIWVKLEARSCSLDDGFDRPRMDRFYSGLANHH